MREGLLLGEGNGRLGGGEVRRSRSSSDDSKVGRDWLKNSSISGAPPRLVSISKSRGSEMIENRADDLRDEPAIDAVGDDEVE
jgi:hypothetical protein